MCFHFQNGICFSHTEMGWTNAQGEAVLGGHPEIHETSDFSLEFNKKFTLNFWINKSAYRNESENINFIITLK